MAEREHSGSVVKQNFGLHAFAEALVAHYVTDFSVEGANYAKQAEKHLKNGLPVEVWFAPHESHADYPLIHKGLTVAVSKEFSHNTYGVMGSMLKKLFITRFLMHAYSGVLVPSIRDVPVTGDKEAWDRREEMKDRAFELIGEIHLQEKVLALNAEGTRIGGEGLKRGFLGVGRYPRLMKGGFILPAVHYGGSDILRVRSKIPKKGQGGVRFEELISVDELLGRVGGLSTREGNQLMVDMVMFEIARLLPQEKRGVYENLR